MIASTKADSAVTRPVGLWLLVTAAVSAGLSALRWLGSAASPIDQPPAAVAGMAQRTQVTMGGLYLALALAVATVGFIVARRLRMQVGTRVLLVALALALTVGVAVQPLV